MLSAFRESYLQSQPGGHFYKETGFWKRRDNESDDQLQAAPVMEQKDQGGGLEGTKAEHYAAVVKSR